MADLAKLLDQARRLSFEGRTEAAFREDYLGSTRRMIRASFTQGTAMYAAFGVLDRYCLPKTYAFALALRLGVVCPILGAVAAITFSRRLYRRVQAIAAFAAITAGVAIAAMIGRSQSDEIGFAHYYVGLILVMMYVSSFIRLRFWSAVLANAAIIASYEVVAILAHALPSSPSGRALFVTNNFFLLAAFFVGGGTCYWLEVAARRDFVQRMALAAEKAETDRLLMNILPGVVVERMKQSADPIADELPGVSVLFADLVNFTALAERMSPQDLVTMLNELFSGFDGLVEKYGLEKIKTIGDCYMVAAGVPTSRPDHAVALASLALDMRDWLRRPDVNCGMLEIRIGISSGPVVAGVIGKKKFSYDLWGDTVNTASRMESHGEPGTIQITKTTRDLIQADFVLDYGGARILKGKGETEVWFVRGRRPNLAPAQCDGKTAAAVEGRP